MKNKPSIEQTPQSHGLKPGEQPPTQPSTFQPPGTAQPDDDRAWDVFLPEDDLEPLPDEFADPWWERDEEPFD